VAHPWLAEARLAVIDFLLHASKLPTLAEARQLARKAKDKTRVIIRATHDKTQLAERTRKLITDMAQVQARVEAASKWSKQLPQPHIAIKGLERLHFYGEPTDLLLPPLLLAIALAGGAWKPEVKRVETRVKTHGKLLLYVTPGLPCAKAIYHSLQALHATSSGELYIINAESMIQQGLKPPVNTVPTFITPSGRKYTITPRSPSEVIELWNH